MIKFWRYLNELFYKNILQRDIDAVVPRDRLPSLADKSKLPYIEATICEVMRRWTVIPLGIPHSTVCDTEVGGYFVSAGTNVRSANFLYMSIKRCMDYLVKYPTR